MKSFAIPLMLVLLISMVAAYQPYYQDYDYQGYADCGVVSKKLYVQESRDIRYVQQESRGCQSCQIVKKLFVEQRPAEVRYIQKDIIRTCPTCYIKAPVQKSYSKSYSYY